jgi:8-oxo-dGTP pyrophosphatase MutT (NUDIX family)
VKELIRQTLAAYEPQGIEDDPLVAKAAVLLLIFEHEGRAHVVFQKRTDHVRDHKGQISFPGGAQDPGDDDLLFTALRETHEEIGVRPEHVEVLGQLDDMITVSNFRVTPFVGWLAAYPYPWRFSDEEVAYLLEVPLDHLRDPANLVPDRRVINGREYVFQSYEWGQDLIWGATARMLGNFLDLLRTVEDRIPGPLARG